MAARPASKAASALGGCASPRAATQDRVICTSNAITKVSLSRRVRKKGCRPDGHFRWGISKGDLTPPIGYGAVPPLARREPSENSFHPSGDFLAVDSEL